MRQEGIEGFITFTYYKDLDKASKFYSETMGFEVVVDMSWVKIYKLAEGAHLGLVDEAHGYFKTSRIKPVMLTFMVSDAEAWYQYLTGKGIRTNHKPEERRTPHMKGFLTWDPEGYVIEILEFLTKPYGMA
jgi:catechol 2,3-dioxygenase-like lactoylglutathione lyase family enzyme